MTDIDPALLARIEAAQTTKELFEIGAEIIAARGQGFSTLSNEMVDIIIARRNAIYDRLCIARSLLLGLRRRT